MQEHAKHLFVKDSWQTPRNARTLAAYMALKNREIGERIAALRKSRGNPPQEVVAQKIDVANRSYQAWEAGDTKPSWRNLSKLAKFYGVTEEYILIGDGPKQSDTPEPLAGNSIEKRLDKIEDKLDKLLAQRARAVNRLAQVAPEDAADALEMLTELRRLAAQAGRDIGRRDVQARRARDRQAGRSEAAS